MPVDPATAASITAKAIPLAAAQARKFRARNEVAQLIGWLMRALPRQSQLANTHDDRQWATTTIFGNGVFKGMFDPRVGLTSDPQVLGFLRLWLDTGEDDVLDVMRDHIVSVLELLPFEDRSVDLEVAADLIVTLIKTDGWRAKESDRAASALQHNRTRGAIEDVGDTVQTVGADVHAVADDVKAVAGDVQTVGAGVDALLGQFAEFRDAFQSARATPAPEQQIVFVDTTWAPKQLKEVLDDFGKESPGELRALQGFLAGTDLSESVPSAIANPPPLVAAGSAALWGVLARYAEDAGRWPAAAHGWLGAAERARAAKRVEYLVNAAIAHRVAGDESRYQALLGQAASEQDDHPRVLLEQFSAIDDPAAQLRHLQDVQMDTPKHQALLEAHRALASLLLNDVDAAEAYVAAAREQAPDVPAVRMIGANVVVQRGRQDPFAITPRFMTQLERARSEALEVREHFLAQRRWSEAERALMLVVDTFTLAGDFHGARGALSRATPDELAVNREDQALAEAALRAMLWREAVDLLNAHDRSPAARRIRARALAHTGNLAERREAVAELDALVDEGGEETEAAALARLTLTLKDRHLDWSDAAEEALRCSEQWRALLVTVRANYLASRKRHAEAKAVLADHMGQGWATEVAFQIATELPDPTEEIELAEDILSGNPDPHLRLQCAVSFLKGQDKQAKRVVSELRRVAEDDLASQHARVEAYRMLSRVALQELDDPRAALGYLNAWAALNPFDEEEHRLRPVVSSRLAKRTG